MTQTRTKSSDQPSARQTLQFSASDAAEAKKPREKVFAIGKEGADHCAASADALTQMLNDAIATSCNTIATCVECGSLTATLATDISSEVADYTTQALSDAVETSQEFLACRTINNVLDWQNTTAKNAMDRFFNQSTTLSQRMFQYASDLLEPVERAAKA